MADLNAALLTQLRNIQTRSGRTLAELAEALAASGAIKPGQRRDWLKTTYGLGHGDATTAVAVIAQGITVLPADAAELAAATRAATGDEPLATLYAGPKAGLLPLHQAIIQIVDGFGACEQAPKQRYVSLRRSKQFATVGPATKTAIEIGLICKHLPPHDRLKALPPGGMCSHSTRVSQVHELDTELTQWLRAAFDAAA